MKKIGIPLIIILLLGGLFAYMWNGKVETNKSTKLIIGYPQLRIALPVIIADYKGYFKEQGLNVKLKSFNTAQPMMDAIVSGKINLGGFCALPITFGAMARSKIQLLFLGGMYEDDNHTISVMLIKKDNNKIKNVEDLKGKRIGILPTRAYEVWLYAILAKHHINAKDVTIKQIKPQLQGDALKNGSVDALFTNDPAATIIENMNIGKLLTQKALVPEATGKNPFYFGSFNVRKDFADNNPDIVKKVAIALDKANDFIKHNNDSKLILAKKNYFPEAFRNIVQDFPNSKFKSSASVSDNDLSTMKNFYLKKHMLPVNIKTDGLQYHY